MDSRQQELIDKLLEVCDSYVSQAYVITDGLKVSAIVLDKKIAEFLCKEMRKQYNTDAWVYLPIPQAVEYAFSCGREYAFEEIRQAQRAEQPVDVSAIGEENGNQELRQGDVQQEAKQD